MLKIRQARRQSITVQRNCSVGVIGFKGLEWSDHVVQMVDISRTGVGVRSPGPIEPGFVWFRERVGGHHGGVLLWSKRVGEKYRAGIKFVPVSDDAETYLHSRAFGAQSHTPARDAETVISTLLDSLKKESIENA